MGFGRRPFHISALQPCHSRKGGGVVFLRAGVTQRQQPSLAFRARRAPVHQAPGLSAQETLAQDRVLRESPRRCVTLPKDARTVPRHYPGVVSILLGVAFGRRPFYYKPS